MYFIGVSLPERLPDKIHTSGLLGQEIDLLTKVQRNAVYMISSSSRPTEQVQQFPGGTAPKANE